MATTNPVVDEAAAAPAGQQQESERADVPGRWTAVRALTDRWQPADSSGEAGMSTAEYAVGTVAACAFAAVLYKVVTGGSVVTALGQLVQSALATLS